MGETGSGSCFGVYEMRGYKRKVLLGNDSFGLSLTVWFGFFSST
jgi:hypothetical protein